MLLSFLLCIQKVAYMISSGVICLIYVLCAVVLFFGVREQKGKKKNGIKADPGSKKLIHSS